MVGPIPWVDDSHLATQTLEGYNYSWPESQSQPIKYGHSPPRPDRLSQVTKPLHGTTGDQPEENHLCTVVRALFTSIPSSVDATHVMRDGYLAHVIGEYQVQRVKHWFSAPSPWVRDSLMARLKGSRAIIRAMYLGAKLFQAIGDNSSSSGALKCIGWIDTLEEQFGSDFYNSSTLNDAADYLLAELE
ncbi:hypothetical protein FRC11_009630, partial [Ceratobasidium sp. 423]